MAILIPSKNIYDKQNPKVRDNVIERIEVGAVEVVPDNEYETTVYNEDISNLSLKSQEPINEDLQETWLINTGAYSFTGACAYAGYNSQKYHEQKVYIPKQKDNSFINKLFLGVDDNNNQNIKTTFVGTKNKGTTSGTWYGNFITSGKNELIVTKGEINYSQPTETNVDERYDIPKEISYTYQSENRGNPTATANLIDIGNLSTVSFDEETKDGIEYYTLQLKILCGIRIVCMGGYDDGMQGTITNCPFVMSGTYEEYIPTNIEITIYGNTIGIALQDQTVYINGETAKKVHSVDGNELMQTSNYYKNSGLNAIENAFSKTKTAYALGKETATIRCSISDYYDYDSGDKMISIDNSTGKMSFKMYDQVIPMVYGADRQDRPMSTYQDGSPKVFQVLGSNIYYDGAVWQELSLQEVDKSQIL